MTKGQIHAARLRPAAGRQTGKGVALPAVAAGDAVSVAVTFPTAYPSPPVVNPIPLGVSVYTWGLAALSETGFTVRFANPSGGNGAATAFDWVADPA